MEGTEAQHCRLCSAVLSAENAWVNRTKGTFQTACKICSKSVTDAWRLKNKDSERVRAREYYKANKDRILDLTERGRVFRKYGVTVEQIEAMRVAQSGLCAICGLERKLVVDHCHRTGKVRALLCSKCNTALGLMADSSPRLESAAAYLLRFRYAE